MDISEVVKHSGIASSVLRYYEERGLIASIGRRGLRRQFDPSVLERLALIGLGCAAGFSLDEVKLMFAPNGQLHVDRQALEIKADELDSTIRKLSAMRDGLRRAAVCPATSHMECPTFRCIVKKVSSGKIQTPGKYRSPD